MIKFFVLLPFIAFISCSPAQTQKVEEMCPVPALRAAVAVAQVAVDVARGFCEAKPTEGCADGVQSAGVAIDKADATLDDVCRALPYLETLPCPECTKPLEAARKAACR